MFISCIGYRRALLIICCYRYDRKHCKLQSIPSCFSCDLSIRDDPRSESTRQMASKQIVLLVQSVDGGATIMKESAFDLITLPHPKGIPIVFVQIAGDLMELQCIEPKKRGSWFINQRVSSSSKVYVATKFDPRFLCLPYLERAGARYCPLDQVVCTNDTAGCSRLPLTKSREWKLDEITDVKDLGDDLILFRFNEVKTLEWLSAKVTRTAIHFMKQRQEKMDTENVAFVSTFQSSSHATVNLKSNMTETTLSEPNSHDTKTAIQVVTDYLSESMTEKLLKAFGLSAADLTDTKNHSSKRKTDWEADLEVLKTVAFACVFCSTMSSHIRLRSV